jgi:hypothetical protein
MTDPQYRPHPLVEKLTTGAGESGATKLLGYFGSTSEGVVKVYPSLDDLSVYLEIREDDIVHVEDAPAEELAHGGSAIWVKANARVERCVSQRTSVEARFLAGSITRSMAKGPAVMYRSPRRLGAVGDYTDFWPCSALVGACLASNDVPCVHTEQWWCPGQMATANSCLTCAGYTCVAECNSAACPPTQRHCTGGQVTLCGCEIYSQTFCG